MDVFCLDEKAAGKCLFSSDVKELAGFGKETGEKNFEGVLAGLQMQTYLITGEFRQRKNRRGQQSGLSLDVFETPETKWGYGHVTSRYKEEPEESWNRIVEQMRKLFPGADGLSIQKLLSIRRSGSKSKAEAVKPSVPEKKPDQKATPQKLPWPENLITEIGLETVFEENRYHPLTKDQTDGLFYALETLKDREKKALLLRYQEHWTLRKTAEYFERSPERIRQIIRKALRKMRHEPRMVYYRIGLEAAREENRKKEERLKEQSMKALTSRNLKELMEKAANIPLRDLRLTVRTYNCLTRAGIDTMAQLLEKLLENPEGVRKIRNLGAKSYAEIVDRAAEFGIVCREAGS